MPAPGPGGAAAGGSQAGADRALHKMFASKDGLDGQFSTEMPPALEGVIGDAEWAVAMGAAATAQAELRPMLCSCGAKLCLCATCLLYLICIASAIPAKNEEIQRKVGERARQRWRAGQ